MSNIQIARKSISAELEYSKQGLSYYQSRIEALEKMLNELETVAELPADVPEVKTVSRRGRPKATQTAAGRGASKTAGAGAVARRSADLPSTGGSFWIDLLGQTGKTAPEILRAAMEKLGKPLSKDQRKKLSQRMVTALNGLVKSGKIADEGSRRERRYFIK